MHLQKLIKMLLLFVVTHLIARQVVNSFEDGIINLLIRSPQNLHFGIFLWRAIFSDVQILPNLIRQHNLN